MIVSNATEPQIKACFGVLISGGATTYVEEGLQGAAEGRRIVGQAPKGRNGMNPQNYPLSEPVSLFAR